MTAVHPTVAQRAPARLELPAPRPINWPAIGVILAILVQAASGVWFASGISARVHAIEEQLPPGALQRLDERTLQMQRVLERLEARP